MTKILARTFLLLIENGWEAAVVGVAREDISERDILKWDLKDMKNLATQNSDGRASWEERASAKALRRKCKRYNQGTGEEVGWDEVGEVGRGWVMHKVASQDKELGLYSREPMIASR